MLAQEDNFYHGGNTATRSASFTIDGTDDDVIYQSVQQALHITVSTRQSRKGEISSWKAFAPAHAGKLAIEAVENGYTVEEPTM